MPLAAFTTFLSISIPNVREMMYAIRGHPNRGLRDLSSTMALMSASSGPFGPGVLGHDVDENSPAVSANILHIQGRVLVTFGGSSRRADDGQAFSRMIGSAY